MEPKLPFSYFKKCDLDIRIYGPLGFYAAVQLEPQEGPEAGMTDGQVSPARTGCAREDMRESESDARFSFSFLKVKKKN